MKVRRCDYQQALQEESIEQPPRADWHRTLPIAAQPDFLDEIKDEDFAQDRTPVLAIRKGALFWLREDPVQFALSVSRTDGRLAWTVEGVGETPAVLLISTTKPPSSIQLEQKPLDSFTYDSAEGLLYIRFPNEARPRELVVEF